MYDNVNMVFEGVEHQALNLENRIESLIEILSEYRYPLLEERKRHLRELYEDRKGEVFASMVKDQALPPIELFHEMVIRFQGFSSDIFLKRASLFFIQLYRKFGWYEENLMSVLHVPADYQVPKILRHFNCINYSDKLAKKIDNNQLIERHGLEEIQIRAATVIACTKLQTKLGWTIADVDTYLWTKRKESDRPFHLTITSDY
jgi:nitric oxide synthase oxygenase domain/subunit